MQLNSAVIDGYQMTETVGGGLWVITPAGRRISILRLGTHVALRQLPEPVATVARIVARWN